VCALFAKWANISRLPPSGQEGAQQKPQRNTWRLSGWWIVELCLAWNRHMTAFDTLLHVQAKHFWRLKSLFHMSMSVCVPVKSTMHNSRLYSTTVLHCACICTSKCYVPQQYNVQCVSLWIRQAYAAQVKVSRRVSRTGGGRRRQNSKEGGGRWQRVTIWARAKSKTTESVGLVTSLAVSSFTEFLAVVNCCCLAVDVPLFHLSETQKWAWCLWPFKCSLLPGCLNFVVFGFSAGLADFVSVSLPSFIQCDCRVPS